MEFQYLEKYLKADPENSRIAIADIAEENMPTVDQWRDKLGLQPDEIIPMGKLCKLDFIKIMERLKKSRTREVLLRSQRSLLPPWRGTIDESMV